MKAVIAIDSFKGSLSSLEAGKAAAEGIKRIFPDAETIIRPVADGGEGTVEALVAGMNGQLRETEVTDPLGRKITAKYGILPDNTAVIEMAAASGLTLLSESERDPLLTTTCGTGEMILDAIYHGCRNFIIGIGGSATNDGGIGCLQALGFGMLDKNGDQVGYGAKGLSQLVSITDSNAVPELKKCSFHVACDVKNPLCGDNGCSAVFAPQKGADAETILIMDEYLSKYAELTKKFNPTAEPETKGAGAAGGLGFALMYYLDAVLESGVDLIIRETNLEEEVKSADIVITGEGCLDAQTAMGKALGGIVARAHKVGVPVVAIAGSVDHSVSALFDAALSIQNHPMALSDAINKTVTLQNVRTTVSQIIRLLSIP